MATQPPADELTPLAEAIASCDRLLIVAAAGLSISDTLPNNPYHSNDDFALHYPTVRRHGYHNAYQAMGLGGDTSVPAAVRVAFMAQHMLNMRHRFPPTQAYELLKSVADTYSADDVFVWTSNVDGCFERAGFDPAQIYTTQGQMCNLQCASDGCGHIWDGREQFEAINAASVDGALTDMALVPTCPTCGSQWPAVRPNLRGGDWFLHAPYEVKAQRLLEWLDTSVATRRRVAILEVGVGPNTPIVTRIPACAFASAVQANGGRAVYVRLNPDAPEGSRHNPADGVAFWRIRQTWRALEPLVQAVLPRRAQHVASGTLDVADDEGAKDPQAMAAWQQQYHGILRSLRTPK